MGKKASLRFGAMLVGVLTALTPAALLAYDATTVETGSSVVAQATATAAPKTTATTTAAPKTTASPAAPKTGNAGILAETGTAGVAALLAVLAVGVVAGGRVMASRR